MQQSLFGQRAQKIELNNADVHYFPRFIPDHQYYFDLLRDSIAWRQDTIQMYGRDRQIPRLNAWYGDAGARYGYSGLELAPQVWTPELSILKTAVENALDTQFNSVLANLYRDGDDSVSWHSDDEPELGFQPLIASLSFGDTRRFSLRLKSEPCKVRHIDLEGGSLLVMSGYTQHAWQHQLSKTKHPVGPRINLTFRRVVDLRSARSA